MGILGHGIYDLSEAARLTRLRPGRVREWFSGRSKTASSPPVFRSDYPSIGGSRAISFHDLIELSVAGQLRDRGVSLQSLRKVHKRLQKDWKTKHPFCRREILTKDGQVFARGLDEQGGEEMFEILTRQRVFPDVLRPFLLTIDYDGATEMARRWSIVDMVVIDPAVSLGKPVVEDVGIATAVLAASYHANGRDAESVADWFKIHPKHVMAAVDFEDGLSR